MVSGWWWPREEITEHSMSGREHLRDGVIVACSYLEDSHKDDGPWPAEALSRQDFDGSVNCLAECQKNRENQVFTTVISSECLFSKR